MRRVHHKRNNHERPITRLLTWLTAAGHSEVASPARTAEAGSPPAAVYTMQRLRAPVSFLLLGGLALVIMGQSVYPLIAPPLRWRVYLLMFIGFSAFVLGGQTIVRQRPPPWLLRPAGFLTRFWSISAGQLVLLFLAPCFAFMASLAAGDQLRMIHPVVGWTAWFLALAAVLASGYGSEKSVETRVTRFELGFLLLLFVIALLLRGVATNQLPTTLSGDEGSAGLAALKFVNGEANNIFTVGWFSFPNLYFAVQSLGILLLGQTIEGLRITSAVAGALTIVALYWLARTLFDRTTAAFAAAYLLTSHYHIHFSRIGLNNVWDGLFAVVALTALWHGWKTGQRRSFVICGLALGLGMYFYVSFRAVPLLVLIWAGCAYLFARPLFRQRFPNFVLAAFIAWVVFIPLALFFWQHPAEFNAPLNRVTIFEGWLEREMQLRGQTATQVVLEQMAKSALGFTHEPLRHWYNPGAPLLLAGAAALFLLGLLWTLNNFSLGHLLILLPLLSVIIAGGFSQDAPASQRYVIAIPLASIFIALPLSQITKWLQRLWPEYQRLVMVGIVAVLAWIMIADFKYYFFDVYDSYILGGLNTETATAIAHYLREHENPEQIVYFFGLPRMGYFSFSTIPYLAPKMRGQDIVEPLTAPPAEPLQEPAIFIFLPERVNELEHVRTAHPGGHYREFRQAGRQPLFMVYEMPQS